MKRRIAAFKRPWFHHPLIIGYILAPLVNILGLRLFLGVPVAVAVSRLFEGYGILATAWLVTAPIVGISLYFVSRFSWYLFLGHSGLVLLDFVVKWATRPAYYFGTVPGIQNILIGIGNVALVVCLAYVLQRDFRSPYFQILPRGWRERRRTPVRHPVDLDGESRVITDLSPSGCFVVAPAVTRAVGSRVRLAFPGHGPRIDCQGDIMRTTEEGYGIRFVGLSAEEKRGIGRLLRGVGAVA
jgi:hypothetical protein